MCRMHTYTHVHPWHILTIKHFPHSKGGLFINFFFCSGGSQALLLPGSAAPRCCSASSPGSEAAGREGLPRMAVPGTRGRAKSPSMPAFYDIGDGDEAAAEYVRTCLVTDELVEFVTDPEQGSGLLLVGTVSRATKRGVWVDGVLLGCSDRAWCRTQQGRRSRSRRPLSLLHEPPLPRTFI